MTAAPTRSRREIGISYHVARKIIDQLREDFGASPLFGLAKDDSLHSSLNAIIRTFDGHNVYPSRKEKAAHLLYFLVNITAL